MVWYSDDDLEWVVLFRYHPSCPGMSLQGLRAKWAGFIQRNLLALVLAGLSTLLMTGCKTDSATPYISPCVKGRVLDGNSNLPLPGVAVHRVIRQERPNPFEVRHGGQALKSPPSVRTDQAGVFLLDSERDLTPFRPTGWYGVSIAFELQGYVSQIIDYTLSNATNSATGEPVVYAGDIHLMPFKP